MNGKVTLIVVSLLLIATGCQEQQSASTAVDQEAPQSLSFTVVNPLQVDRVDEALVLSVDALCQQAPDFNPQGFYAVADGVEIPSQALDENGEGLPDKVVLLLDIAAGATQQITLHYHPTAVVERSYPQRTQAELSHKFGGHWEGREYQEGHFENVQFLRCPPEHTDHSGFIRYEGPGWESDLVGYRFYLDWRNAIDIFGKKTTKMVLQDVGLDGLDSYHEMSDWGADILKVGDSLGIGSMGYWTGSKVERVAETEGLLSRIVASGPIWSQIQTIYVGWSVPGLKMELIDDLTIHAGTRMSTHNLRVQGGGDNLCTGIGKLEGATVLKSTPSRGTWGYLATYGKQTLFDDNLGMAVFYRKGDLLTVTEDDLNHVVVLKPKEGKLTYHFLAAWEQEPKGIKTQDAFVSYLNETLKRLNKPLEVQWSAN